ncbi:hypothetical protein HKBW3S33_02226, partial [Candidatus Hakubella thermalkaliphila]
GKGLRPPLLSRPILGSFLIKPWHIMARVTLLLLLRCLLHDYALSSTKNIFPTSSFNTFAIFDMVLKLGMVRPWAYLLTLDLSVPMALARSDWVRPFSLRISLRRLRTLVTFSSSHLPRQYYLNTCCMNMQQFWG